jgi:hypothetical protein
MLTVTAEGRDPWLGGHGIFHLAPMGPAALAEASHRPTEGAGLQFQRDPASRKASSLGSSL